MRSPRRSTVSQQSIVIGIGKAALESSACTVAIAVPDQRFLLFDKFKPTDTASRFSRRQFQMRPVEVHATVSVEGPLRTGAMSEILQHLESRSTASPVARSDRKTV